MTLALFPLNTTPLPGPVCSWRGRHWATFSRGPWALATAHAAKRSAHASARGDRWGQERASHCQL